MPSSEVHAVPDGTPRRLSFSSPSLTRSGERPGDNGVLPNISSPASSVPQSPSSLHSSPNLGGGISHSPRHFPVQDFSTRSIRASTREKTSQSHLQRGREEDRLRTLRGARDFARPSCAQGVPETIPEEDDSGDAPYTSFSGSPRETWGGSPHDGASDMEATVAELVFEGIAERVVQGRSNISSWIDVPFHPPDDAVRGSNGALVFDATAESIQSALSVEGLSTEVLSALSAAHASISGKRQHVALSYLDYASRSIEYGLRADSPGAPDTYSKAIERGPPWPGAIDKEFANHEANKSWDLIDRSAVPAGRRIHKFVWVFKEKRDGTAKARLCVQGCTLEEGIDYDQTFAKPLRHASARGLFAYAARNKCNVRSIDFVAAYLQGDFMDGEVVYCHQPPGSSVIGSDGRPKVCVVTKPIYGIPQAGRRLQRKIFPWCVDVMGLRQLDDSDDCVFVWDDPAGKETFAVGIYVDNMQIVHSAELNEDGEALDNNSFYAKFISRLRQDWDVVDEGPMSDLLGIDCERASDGSIKLHQGRYIRKLLARFSPDGPKHKRCSVPYSADLPRLVIEALEKSTADSPAYPDLVKPYQKRVGALMYACTGTRPDLAYAVHQHCRCLSRPTPELLDELDYVMSYLYENSDIGIRFVPGEGTLRGTADASWEVRESTSGWVIYWHGAPLCWGSKKQKSIALSSCESEIIALSEAAKDVVYLRKFTRGLVPKLPPDATVLSTDNKAARDLSYNPEHHGRSKHIARRHFFIRDMVESQEIIVPLVNTNDNDADFFTKPLALKRFKMLRRKVMSLSDDSNPPRPSFAGGRLNAGG